MLHAARCKIRTQKLCQKSPSAHHRTTLLGYIFTSKACIDNQKKNLLNGNISSICPHQYGDLRPTNGWDLLASLGHPSKFQRVLRLGFVTAPTSLNRGQPNFARCLAVSCAGILYIHFWSSCPLTEFCQLQNSPCVQVLHSPTLEQWALVKFAAWYKEWSYRTFGPLSSLLLMFGASVL